MFAFALVGPLPDAAQRLAIVEVSDSNRAERSVFLAADEGGRIGAEEERYTLLGRSRAI